jgi:FtsP/CotA-like multicopper oxidase with cupredoxin domain
VKKFTLKKSYAAQAALLASLCLVGGTANALDLCAGEFTKTVAGQAITMWGYALGGDTAVPLGVCDGVLSSPGPEIRVLDTDPSLTIILTNTLAETTSLVIPGQAMPDGSAPVFWPTGSAFEGRVRSFSTEAPAGGIASYTWSAFKPGTYAYHSGTQPSLQSQMGMYGAAIKDFAVGQAYACPLANPTCSSYNNEVVLFYSEIASALHDDPVTGLPLPTPARPLNYHPDYFLVNGAPFTDKLSATIAAGSAGQTTLVRMINMGIEQHLPVFQGLYLDVIAEDGNLYPHKRRQHTVMLTPVKTKDALVTPNGQGTHAVYDAAMGLSNAGASPGGMLAFLEFGASTSTTVAVDDSYTTDEDVPFSAVAGDLTTPGVLDNDTNPVEAILVASPASGTLLCEVVTDPNVGGELCADGSFTYTPAQNFNGNAAFTYKASTDSNTATATITVIPVNDAPIADPNGPYLANVNVPLTLDGTGSSDPDGDPLTYSWDFDYDGLTFTEDATGATPTHTYVLAGTFRVALIVHDGTEPSALAETKVDVTVGVNIPPVAEPDFAEMQKVTTSVCDQTTGITILVTGNDFDPDADPLAPNNGIDTSTVVITEPPNRGGTATFIGNGNVLYCPKKNFKGQEIFSYTVDDLNLDDNGDPAPATSNQADVSINVLK